MVLPTPANPQHAPFGSSACMQDSNSATTTRAGGSARREPVMDRTTTMRVSPCHPFFSFLLLLPFLIPLPCMVLCCEHVCARRTLANPSFFFQHRITRLCAAIAAAPKLRSPGLHLEPLCDMSWMTRFHFYLIHSSSSPPRPSSDIS